MTKGHKGNRNTKNVVVERVKKPDDDEEINSGFANYLRSGEGTFNKQFY